MHTERVCDEFLVHMMNCFHFSNSVWHFNRKFLFPLPCYIRNAVKAGKLALIILLPHFKCIQILYNQLLQYKLTLNQFSFFSFADTENMSYNDVFVVKSPLIYKTHLYLILTEI